MPQTLTTTTLEKKRVDPGEFIWLADNHTPGLRVRLSNSHAKTRTVTFYYRYRDRNDQTLIQAKIGEYPGCSLKEARTLVDEELKPEANDGKDVRAYLRRKRQATAAREGETLRALIPEFLSYLERRKKSAATVVSLRRYLRPIAHKWGDRLPIDVTRGDVKDLFDSVKADGVPPYDIDGSPVISSRGQRKGGHRAAGHTLSAGSSFWTWLLDREKSNTELTNPWRGHKDLRKESVAGTSNRVLNAEELTQVLQSAREILSPGDATPLLLMLATGLRPGEVCGAEWKEFDVKISEWIIPARRMKYKEADHTVFLSEFATNVITSWRKIRKGRPRYLFPATSKFSRRPHLSPDNLGERLTRFKIKGFTPKVCRATVRTGLQKLGCPKEVRARMSHHQHLGKVPKSYDHHPFDDEAKDWWNKWGQHLSLISQGEPSQVATENLR